MSKYTTKLGSNGSYKRPLVTAQEKLTADEISSKLEGYEKVDDINDVPINTHMRYFIKKDNTMIFRTGGFLYNKQNSDKYIILSNGKNTWSVQIKDTIFYRKLSHKEEIDAIHRHYLKKIKEKDTIIKDLKRQILDLSKHRKQK